MYVNRNQWFFGDEWDFLADRSVTIGEKSVLEPHNEHWSTTPILLYGLLFRATGLTSYLPYVAVVVAAHLVVVHLMWRVALRADVRPWIATVFCAAFILYGPGSENLLWAFQVGFVGSVALGLAVILIADSPGDRPGRLAAGWAASAFALTFSGISIPLVGAAGIVRWMRGSFTSFLSWISVPAAVYLMWLVTAGRDGTPAIPPSAESLGLLHVFFGRAVGSALSLGSPTWLAGLVPLVLSLAALRIRNRRGRSLPFAAVAAGIGWVLLLAILAVGRTSFGLEVADSSRYVYIGGALLLPLLLVGVSDLVGGSTRGAVVLLAVVTVWGVSNVAGLRSTAREEAERERLIREQLVAAGTLLEPETLLGTQPDPVFSPELHMWELRIFLPDFAGGVDPGREAVMRAALALQVSVKEEPKLPVTRPISRLHPSDSTLTPLPEGCALARPAGTDPLVLIPFRPASSMRLSTEEPVSVQVSISSGGLEPGYAGWGRLEPGTPVYLNIAVEPDLVGEGAIVFRFTSEVRLCGAPSEA